MIDMVRGILIEASCVYEGRCRCPPVERRRSAPSSSAPPVSFAAGSRRVAEVHQETAVAAGYLRSVLCMCVCIRTYLRHIAVDVLAAGWRAPAAAAGRIPSHVNGRRFGGGVRLRM